MEKVEYEIIAGPAGSVLDTALGGSPTVIFSLRGNPWPAAANVWRARVKNGIVYLSGRLAASSLRFKAEYMPSTQTGTLRIA